MALDIDTAFITQFESEVHVAYQRMGSKLRNTVRVVPNVNGSTARFQKVAKGTASTKARHGQVAAMDLDHSNVDCTLSDYYAADYVDKLDELKINIDERQVVAMNAAAALGRKTDELITTAMDGATNEVAHGSAGMTQAKAFEAFEGMGDGDVPDDGQRFAAVGPQQWTDLLGVNSFVQADYIGYEDLPFKGGMTAKRWLGFIWFTHSGLPKASTTRKCFMWHRSSVGMAVGADVTTELNYVPEKVSHLITSMLSQGSVLIDADGIYEVQATES
jgi:hypothetical protein